MHLVEIITCLKWGVGGRLKASEMPGDCVGLQGKSLSWKRNKHARESAVDGTINLFLFFLVLSCTFFFPRHFVQHLLDAAGGGMKPR